MDDRAVVERQLGRPPRAFRRVVCRCPFGRPAVTEQAPYDDSGEPFPTTYYLTCPHLVAAVSRLEAAGGVERWTEAAASEPELARSLHRATAEQRQVRRALAGSATGRDEGASLELGIGGAARPERLKCLHAHAAFALANPGYELGERIVAEIDPLWPESCCMDSTGRMMPPSSRMSSVAVEHARQQWEEGHRRLESRVLERPVYNRLHAQVEALTDELRRRVGQTFTMAQLADVYAGAERWSREAAARGAPETGRPEDVAIVEDAAFHLYSRGAVDYVP